MTAYHEPGRGSVYRYNQGCRCAECRELQRTTRARQRELGRIEGRASYRRELDAASLRKRTVYAGTCEHCGGPTTGCAGPGRAPTVCVTCAPRVYGPRYRADKLGHGKRIEALLDLLAEPRRFREIRDALGITDGHTGALLDRHLKSGLIRRVSRGVYARG